jgi:hypothetical protein
MSLPGMGGPAPGGNRGGAATTTNTTHRRTEFVILFIWQEPTPSDGLRAGASASPGGVKK